MANEAELLADLLDGRIDPAEVPPELAELAELADTVSTHITLVPPTEAFREALREQVLEATGGAAAGGSAAGGAAGGGAGAGSGATMMGVTAATGGLPSIIAAVAATAVLATGGIAAVERAGPGDLLYDTKRGVESVQLAVADDERDVELLVGFAAERVREAVGLADIAVVNELLQESERLLDEALALAAEQGRDLEELLQPYTGALLTLASRTDDPGVTAHIQQLLDDLGMGQLLRGAGAGTSDGLLDDLDVGPGDGTAEQDATNGTSGDGQGSNDDASDEGPVDDTLDGLEEPLDEVGETLEDPVGELDETLDELDDPLDGTAPLEDTPLEDSATNLEEGVEVPGDGLDGPVEELGGGIEDGIEETEGVVQDSTGLLGD